MAIILDSRLSAIAKMVGETKTLADIGADHGRLGAYLLSTRKCERAQLTDISADSLKKARELIGKLSLEDKVDFCVGDGAFALKYEPETAVIAGMGGETIAEIIKKGREKLGNARLILEPNVGQYFLRKTLAASGYHITDENVVRDGHRLYCVIEAQKGEAEYSDLESFCGPVLIKKRPDELYDMAAFRIRVIEKAINQAEKSAVGFTDTELLNEYKAWREVISWRQQEK